MNGNPSFPDPSQTGSVQPPMVYVKEKTVWEYKLVERNLAQEKAPSEQELNQLGADGWEMAGVFTDSPFVYFYFKRAKE